MAKNTALATMPSEEDVNALAQGFPQEAGFSSIQLPRLGMYSQDKFEGKGKSAKLVQEAGIFFVEKQDEKETQVRNEQTGKVEMKKLWQKEELENEIELTILYSRKQLKFYDNATQAFISSRVYDNDDDVIPLYTNGAGIASGTPAQLKADYMAEDKRTGKMVSELKETRVLFVLYKGELYQMNIGGSSMFNYFKWVRTTVPPAHLTKLSSEARESGSINWNAMLFENVRGLTKEEVEVVKEKTAEIVEAINVRKSAPSTGTVGVGMSNRDFHAYKGKEDTAPEALPRGRR